ncbi:MAG: hypothetical protein U0R44_01365 [Candidatus Micrarchaeia archaeon]
MIRRAAALLESRLLKVIVFVILPFLYGFSLPHVQAVSDNLASPSLIGNNSGLTFKATEGQVSIPDGINSIFPLAKYFSFWPLVSVDDPYICFEDNGSYVTYTNGTKLPAAITWDVDFNGRNVTIPQNSVNCTPIEFNQKFRYAWTGRLYFLIGRNETLKNVSVVPLTNTYHSFDYDYGVLQGLALIPALYLFFWYPMFGIWRKIEKGWKEQ